MKLLEERLTPGAKNALSKNQEVVMAEDSLEHSSSAPVPSLAEIAHRMKGLLGIFDTVGSTLPSQGDAKDIFNQGLDRMRELNTQIDLHLQQKS